MKQSIATVMALAGIYTIRHILILGVVLVVIAAIIIYKLRVD